jgi:hypothetical protein
MGFESGFRPEFGLAEPVSALFVLKAKSSNFYPAQLDKDHCSWNGASAALSLQEEWGFGCAQLARGMGLRLRSACKRRHPS